MDSVPLLHESVLAQTRQESDPTGQLGTPIAVRTVTLSKTSGSLLQENPCGSQVSVHGGRTCPVSPLSRPRGRYCWPFQLPSAGLMDKNRYDEAQIAFRTTAFGDAALGCLEWGSSACSASRSRRFSFLRTSRDGVAESHRVSIGRTWC